MRRFTSDLASSLYLSLINLERILSRVVTPLPNGLEGLTEGKLVQAFFSFPFGSIASVLASISGGHLGCTPLCPAPCPVPKCLRSPRGVGKLRIYPWSPLQSDRLDLAIMHNINLIRLKSNNCVTDLRCIWCRDHHYSCSSISICLSTRLQCS